MARSVDEIYQSIIKAKGTHAELNALDSTSKTAIWRLWAYVTASVLFTVEKMYDVLVAQIQDIFTHQKPGNLMWYRSMCMNYRYGATIVIDNQGRLGYPTGGSLPEPIIKQCAVKDTSQGLLVKIAKEDNGELVRLSDNEFSNFNVYLSRMKYAGTPIRVINANANLLHVDVTIHYDPLILHANGTSIINGKRIVDEAIQQYLRSLPFDGRLKIVDLTEILMQINAVKDISNLKLRHKYEQYEYEEVDVSVIPYSGYFKISPEFPLEDTINYIAYV